MSRIRSRQVESEAVPTRVLRKDAATSDKIGTHSVRWNKEQWPGGPKVRQSDLAADVIEVIDEHAADTARPATVLLTADDVAVPSGEPTTVEFTDVVLRHLVEWDAPSDELVWPWTGTIMLYVEGAWDDVDPGDAVVEILIGDAIVWNVRAASLADGVLLVLQANDVSVPHATDVVVEFTVAEVQNRVNWDGPSGEIVWPMPGTVKLDVAGRWDDTTTVEQVEVLVDDVAVWPPAWLPLPGSEVS